MVQFSCLDAPFFANVMICRLLRLLHPLYTRPDFTETSVYFNFSGINHLRCYTNGLLTVNFQLLHLVRGHC